jgi:hypothetical protein
MKTSIQLPPGRAGLRRTAAVLALLVFAAAARCDPPPVEPYEKDVNFLASKVAQYRYRLKSTPEGAQRLSAMETGVAELKSAVSELKEQSGEIESKDGHLKYLKDMELGPKERAVEQVRRSYKAFVDDSNRDFDALRQAISVHNSANKIYQLPDEQGALDAYNAEKAALDSRTEALKARYEEKNGELRALLDAAIQLYTKAQEEFSETATKREQAAQRFQTQADQYASSRGAVVTELEALDNEPAPAVIVPLTPFSNGVPIGEAGTVAITKAPIGPGNNTHALDQLRVVTASSRDAAPVDEKGRPVAGPAEPVAKQESGYVFDNGVGTGMAALPEVGTPASKPAEAVPLVVPAAPENAPPAIKNSPTLQKFAQAQTDGFSKLDQLYQQRRELMQLGAKATPEAWTQVVKEISQTQAAVNMAGVGLKLTEGSQLIDLTIVPKSQHKVSDLTLPPSPSPETKQP